jgi:hypothetical protein
MGRYLKLAMAVVNRQEPIQHAVVSVVGGEKDQITPPSDVGFLVRRLERTVAVCGYPACAGCYDIGDGRKIHPPKCGNGYADWLKRWEPRGRKQ